MRLIDADMLMFYVRQHWEELYPKDGAIIDAILVAKTVEAEPIRHGKWIKVEDDYNNHLYECSYCHTWTSLPIEEVNDRNIRYCWSCGAKMDK